MLKAATACVDVARDAELLKLKISNEDVLTERLRAIRDRFQVDEVTKTDVSQAESRLARAESERIKAKGNLRISQAAFLQAQVDAARLAREGVQREEEPGKRSLLDSLDADQELLEAQVGLVLAQRDEFVARFAPAASLGLLTPVTLGFPELTVDYDLHSRTRWWKIMGMDVDIVEDGH